MRANPGGEISRDEVIGRDDLIASLWAALAQQSIVLVAERRAGKTTIIKKMRHQPAHGFAPIYRDVENLSTPLEFIERLCEDVRPHLSAAGQVGATFSEILKKFSGGEVAGVLKFPARLIRRSSIASSGRRSWMIMIAGTCSTIMTVCRNTMGTTICLSCIMCWTNWPVVPEPFLCEHLPPDSAPRSAVNMATQPAVFWMEIQPNSSRFCGYSDATIMSRRVWTLTSSNFAAIC